MKMTALMKFSITTSMWIICFFTGSDVKDLTTKCDVATSRMAEGGFELKSWVSNDANLQTKFQEENVGTIHDSEFKKVLFYRYFPGTDELSVAKLSPQQSVVITKRSVLSHLSKIFDPIGLVLPVVVKGKIFIQKLWQRKLKWDEPLYL